MVKAVTSTKVMKAVNVTKTSKAVKATKVVGMKEEKDSKAMKKVPIAMKVSKVARGRLAKNRVFKGHKEVTAGGLRKADLTRNRTGKIVSAQRSAYAKQTYASTIGKWIQAVMKARQVLGITGFLGVKKGSPVYNKAREFYKP